MSAPKAAVVAAALAALAMAVAAQPAGPVPARGLVPPPPRSETGIRWQSLTPSQRQALAPLERDWPTIGVDRKQKWLTIADRFGHLPPAERGRISERMTEWSRLTPSERGELRLRYQESKQVPAPDRSARWEAYQALPPEQRQQFVERATVVSPRAANNVAARKRDTAGGKTNVVPNPALVQPLRPVAPAVVQAAPGATTRLVNRPPAPPAHQQSGMPKIGTTPELVNRSTLLPRLGPQAAAVAAPRPQVAPVPAPRLPDAPKPPKAP